MKKVALGTNNLGMHIVIRPISKALLSKDETVGIETQKINSLLTARRPIALADAISALPPLLPPSVDPITGRRLYSIEEIMSGSCGIHFGPSVPELLYRIVYRGSLNIGICQNCGAPFLQSGIGSLNDVCSQACRMAQRRRKGLA